MVAEDEYVEIDSFVPDPGQSKRTTFSKAQRKKVARGHDTVTKQDNAMWATLTGKPILCTAKKCLLAVTMFGNAFYSAVGQSTTFVDPGPQGNMCGKGLD